jgi:hypothetical protein
MSLPERQAFHFIRQEYLDDVIKSGDLLPAIYRIHPGVLKDKCNPSDMEETIVRGFDDPKPKKTAMQYYRRLVSEALKAVRDFQRSRGVRTTKHATEFQCNDLLAGDLECVFLSLDDWVSWGRSATGLIFDARDLVSKGAYVRPVDVNDKYWRVLREAFRTDWKSYSEFEKRVLSWFGQVQSTNSLSGEEAADYLQGPRVKNVYSRLSEDDNPPEIVVCGSVPVEWAVAYCIDGHCFPLGG